MSGGDEMASKFMSTHINLFLVTLLVFVVLMFTGLTVFFRDEVDVLSASKTSATTNLSECQEQVASYREQLTVKLGELNESAADIKVYDELYAKKASEVDELSS
ncbi:MAG: hypothetical protein HC945_03910, partial [Nitrosarchaeum sp.]|nr:hypothetical protein [Nitrosarchaeum sp.]